MNITKKTLLPLVAVGIAISTFTDIAAEPSEATSGSKARPNAAEVGKGAPPSWVITSPEVVKRAEAGDADAMAEIANGYMELAMSPRIEANDKEREAMRKEAMGWLRRRAKIMADREGDVESVRKRAEAGDAAAQRNLGFRYSQGVDVEKDEKKAFEWTKKAAEQGDAKAMFNLANDYASGSGTKKDADEAVEWFRKAAYGYTEMAKRGESFDQKPLLLVGQELLDEEGDYREFDPQWRKALGMGFLAIAAREGNAEAMRELGEQFAMGKNTEENLDLAVFWLRKADMHGDKNAMECLGKVHVIASGRLFKALDEKAKAGDKEAEAKCNESLELFRQGLLGNDFAATKSSAIIGYAPSQADLGRNYMMGQGVPQDKKKAVEWWRKAVDQGEYRAMFWLGTAYERGDGVVKDDYKAFDLWERSHSYGWEPATGKLRALASEYRKGAEKGDASAEFFLGVAFEQGFSSELNPEEAVKWYRKAAGQGHPGAQTFLAFALLTGSGIAKDPEQAVAWFRKAAEKGNSEAQQNLGRCLFYGEGCEENKQEAVSWYRKAAEQGEPGAMFNLGASYMEGTGVEKDLTEAEKWFRRAASLGHERAAELLKKHFP